MPQSAGVFWEDGGGLLLPVTPLSTSNPRVWYATETLSTGKEEADHLRTAAPEEGHRGHLLGFPFASDIPKMPRAAKRKNETKPNPLFRAEHPVKGRPKFRKLRRLLSVPAKHLPRQQRQSGGPTAGRPGRDKGPSPPAASCKTGPAQSTAFHQSRVRRPQGAVTKYSSSLPPCQGSIADGLVGSLNSPLHKHTRNPRISVSTEAEWGARSSNPTWKPQNRGPLPLPG